MKCVIYLDYNATTPIDPLVATAMRPWLETWFGNPSSGHRLGRDAREAVETARAAIARLIGADAEEIIFTSGGTEASNLAIKGLAWARGGGGHFVTTVVEHPATLEPIRWLERFGFSQTQVDVDGTGMVDPEDIRRAIRPDTVLISVMHAQNEVGTIEPIEEIGRIAQERQIAFHVDVAQSAGKIPVDVRAMNADLVSIAGHKLYGPKGIGALYVRKGIKVERLIHGAKQESGRRGGTENVMMAVGLGRAAELAGDHLAKGSGGILQNLRDYFWQRLAEQFGDRVVLNGHATRRLPNTLNVSFPGHVGGEILAKLDGVYASTGAACHSGSATPSAVLTAMGVSPERAIGTIRFSIGHPTRKDEIDTAVGQLAGVVVD